FIWLSNAAKPKAVAQFIIDAYRLLPPHLILSIQTDYRNIQGPPDETLDLEGVKGRAIQHGLVETAKITNAWIITNGIYNVMNRLVGEGLCDDVFGDDIPCIGLCNWSYEEGTFNINIRLPFSA
ncbi:unnamed protein product, partial [Rotaria sp. Silwood2]